MSRGLKGRSVDRYEIVEHLRRGGAGEVYRAEDPETGTEVALMILDPKLSSDPRGVRRFFVEAGTVSAVSHRNIAAVRDCKETSPFGPYVVTEYNEGETLRELLLRMSVLSAPMVSAVVTQVATALQTVHTLGMVHRNIDPENILLVGDPTPTGVFVQLLGFGMVRLVKGDDLHLARLRSRAGTPTYLSPEQCSGSEDIDARADIYSLAVTAYEALCGRPPFTATNREKLVSEHLEKEIPRAPLGSVGVPAAVQETLLKALAKSRDDRHARILQFANDLEAAVEATAEEGPAFAPTERVDRSSSSGIRRPVVPTPRRPPSKQVNLRGLERLPRALPLAEVDFGEADDSELDHTNDTDIELDSQAVSTAVLDDFAGDLQDDELATDPREDGISFIDGLATNVRFGGTGGETAAHELIGVPLARALEHLHGSVTAFDTEILNRVLRHAELELGQVHSSRAMSVCLETAGDPWYLVIDQNNECAAAIRICSKPPEEPPASWRRVEPPKGVQEIAIGPTWARGIHPLYIRYSDGDELQGAMRTNRWGTAQERNG